MSRMSTIVTVCTLALLAAGAGAQTQRFVPKDFPTIQAAVDASSDGDEVVISGGTYHESVTVTGMSTFFLTGKGRVVIAPDAGDGLTLTGCDHCFIQNLRVKGGETGIRLVDCVQNVFFKGGVEGTAGAGVRVEGGSLNTFEKLTVKDAGGDAFDLATDSAEPTDINTIIVCRIIHPALDGVGIHGSNNHVDTCRIVGAGRHGIALDDTTTGTNNVLKDNRIVKPALHGILVQGDDTHVDGCKVVAPAGSGLDFDSGTGGYVEDCKFTKCGGNGAVLFGDGMTLDTLTFTRPASDGVRVDGGLAVVMDCKVTAAGEHGYSIEGSDGTYTGNTSAKAAQDGFRLLGTGNTLAGNVAKGSKGFDLENPVPANNTVDPDNDFGTVGP